jgi:FMN phosphatase YigB (HAD superfamily)/CTP:molybdopterin cytidylyltransferase MocA
MLVSAPGREVGPVEGLIFDLGGTLDADGVPWAERFRTLLAEAGLTEGALESALEAGERAVLRHPRAADLRLAEMVEIHLAAQLERLEASESGLLPRLLERFVSETAGTLAGRRGLLERLAARIPLAAVSNGCGNTRRLLAEAGLEPFFRSVVDSSQCGFWKPDPRIFEPALARLEAPRDRVAVVGDRLDRDVEAARAAALRAVWVCGPRAPAAEGECPPGVNAVLRGVSELDPGRGSMKAGILAAGLGERLRSGGIATPKALMRVGGRTLLGHALAAVAEAGASQAVVAVNDRDAGPVGLALREDAPPIPVELVQRTTSSSFETFALLASRLRGESHALLAMVDGVFEPGAASRFGEAVRAVLAGSAEDAPDGLIGVTDRRDEDRPLRVRVDGGSRILAIGPGAEGSRWSTAGLYLLPARAFVLADSAEGVGALRDHLARLVGCGIRLRAEPLGAVVDVDRPDDLAAAERLARHP